MTRWRTLATASIWLVLCLSLWVTDARPAVVALAGIVTAAVAVVLSVVDIARDMGDTGWPRVRRDSRPNTNDQWVQQLHSQLVGARRGSSAELHGRLVSLMDARRYVRAVADSDHLPPTTDHPLTPALLDLRAGAPRRLGSQRTLEQILNDIEAM